MAACIWCLWPLTTNTLCSLWWYHSSIINWVTEQLSVCCICFPLDFWTRGRLEGSTRLSFCPYFVLFGHNSSVCFMVPSHRPNRKISLTSWKIKLKYLCIASSWWQKWNLLLKGPSLVAMNTLIHSSVRKEFQKRRPMLSLMVASIMGLRCMWPPKLTNADQITYFVK